MAVSIADLIAKKESIAAKKKQLYDVKTSVGTMTFKAPTKALMSEVFDLSEDNDEYLIYNSVVNPDLSDKKLQEAYGCMEPTDIVDKLLLPGEVRFVARAITKTVGYYKEIATELHEEVKN